MNPNKKRILKILALAYVASVVAFVVQSALTTDSKGGRKRTLDESLIGAKLTQPLVLKSLDGRSAQTKQIEALVSAGVMVVSTEEGLKATGDPNLPGKKFKNVTLPAKTEITRRLWDDILAAEKAAAPKGEPVFVYVAGVSGLMVFDWTLLLVVMNFLGLLVILYLLLWEPILKVLDDRAAAISSDLAGAAAKHKEAATVKKKYDQMLFGSKQQRQELIAEGRQEGQSERRRIVEVAQQEAEKIVARTSEELQAAADKVRRDLRAEIGGLSVQLAEKILRREVKAQDNQQLVQDFLAKLNQMDVEK
ncbi:MAG: F0F1 ATP synthase subunit B [Anaerolineaceae bacterium]|nr:F0F1 ATP synthase subunit B [Anaerolineaceae bacterium]